MRKNDEKFKKHCTKSAFYAINNVHGITLTTLVVTIVVLLILAGVATYSGIEAIDNTKRTKFIAELKIMQSHVNQWYEDCKPSVNATDYEEKFATNVQTKFTINDKVAVNAASTDSSDSEKVTAAQTALTRANIQSDKYGNFYLLEETELQALGVEGVSQAVLVSIRDRKVVSYLGLKYKGNMYYTIDSLDGENGIDTIYNVGYENPNSGQPAFEVKCDSIEPGISEITVYNVQYDTGYNTKWKVYYKKDYDEKWQTSDDLSFIVTNDGVYTIKLTNQNGDIVGTTTKEIGAFSYKKKNSALSGTNDKTKLTSKNPVIPQGFKAVDTQEAKWKYKDNTYSEIDGWNNGLVIEDDIGNQFVWVPCSLNEITETGQPTIVAYNNDYVDSTYDLNYYNSYDTTTVDGVTYYANPVRENEQVNTYGGFYIARFEAGLPTDTLEQSAELNNVYTSIPVSKYGSKVWNYIDFTHSYVAAEKMINNTRKYGKNKSGLITGKQWDTIMKWYEENNINVRSGQNWGTYLSFNYTVSGLFFYRNSTPTIWRNGNGSRSEDFVYHGSGLYMNGYKKNIADLGGNFWERTSEKKSDNIIARGGCASNANSFSAIKRMSSSRRRRFDVRLPCCPIHPRRTSKRICYRWLTCLL